VKATLQLDPRHPLLQRVGALLLQRNLELENLLTMDT
jgi:hypothetical protein